MNNEELVNKVAQMLADGKGELLEQAINKIESETENFRFGNEDSLDEYSTKTETHLITEALSKIREAASAINNPISIMPVPTLYGVALLVDLTDYNYSNDEVAELLYDFTVIPIKIEMVTISDGTQIECMASTDEEKIGLSIVIPKQPVNKKYGYKLPVEGIYFGLAAIATDLNDMANAVKTWMKMQDMSGCLKLPEKGCMICPSGLYSESECIDKEIVYLKDAKYVFRELGMDDTNEDIFIIQAGINTFESSEYNKTTQGIILKEITKETLKEICN